MQHTTKKRTVESSRAVCAPWVMAIAIPREKMTILHPQERAKPIRTACVGCMRECVNGGETWTEESILTACETFEAPE